MLVSKGQKSGYDGTALMLAAIPKAPVLIEDRGYDADWFRDALHPVEGQPEKNHHL